MYVEVEVYDEVRSTYIQRRSIFLTRPFPRRTFQHRVNYNVLYELCAFEERMSSRVSNLFFSALTWQVRLQAAVEAEAAAKRAVLRTGAFTATAVTTGGTNDERNVRARKC